jgi:predicted Zn-dependent peptidase
MTTSTAQPAPLSALTLHSGAKHIHQFMPGSPRIAVSVYIPGGNRLDPVFGMSDILDRLLMKGTEKRSQEQIARDIDSLTLEMDTDTKRDYSVVYATFMEEDLDASLELLADCLFNSTFVEFDKEKEKIDGEIQMDLDSPRARSSDLFMRSVFPDLPYGVVGSVMKESLPKLNSLDALKQHHKAVYRPERLLFSTAGDLPQNLMIAALERHFPGWSEPSGQLGDAWAEKLTQHRIAKETIVPFARDDSNQAHIFQGWIVPSLIHADYYPLVVMNTILGGAGLSSRLFLELRDKQGLAYNVRSSLESYMHSGLFYLYIGTEPSNKAKCFKGFADECKKLTDIPVSEQELQEAKQNILGRRNVYLETPGQLANYVGSSYLMGRSLEEIQNAPDFINAVTSADIQRVAQTYLSQPFVASIVAPSSVL